jgi:hypothetical protein
MGFEAGYPAKELCMSFDPTVEQPIPLCQVPRLAWLPRRRRGRKIHVATIFRWAQHGIHGVRLEVVRIGGTRCTSEAALRRFFAALSAADPVCSPPSAATAPRSPATAGRAHRRAERELAKAGI